jgi:hypothetical protein
MRTETYLHKSLMLAYVLLFTFSSCKKNDALTESAREAESLSARKSASSDSQTGPAPPANIRLDPSYNATPFTVRITWDAPEWTDVLVYRDSSTTLETVIGYDANLDPHYRYTLDRLQQNTSYTFRFQSRNSENVVGPISQPFTFTTQPTNDFTPPTNPTNLSFSCDPYSIYVTCNNSTDNYDPAQEIVYEFYDADSGQRVFEIPRTATFFVTNGNRFLLAGHKYFVKARDRSGNRSAPSNSAIISASCQI